MANGRAKSRVPRAERVDPVRKSSSVPVWATVQARALPSCMAPVDLRHENAAPRAATPRADIDGRLFECATLRELQERVGPDQLQRAERIQFDLIIAPTVGHGEHEVDFIRAPINPHHWVHIRAGQAHRWVLGGYDADLILLEPLPDSSLWHPGPRVVFFDNDQLRDVARLMAFLRTQNRPRIDPVVMSVTRDLMVEWFRLKGDPFASEHEVYTRFRNLIERRVTELRTVEEYAQLLGASPRALKRACREAGVGQPKTLIEQGLVLEAKRLFVQSNATLSNVTSFLGFPDVESLVHFFRRVDGQTPMQWQAQHVY